VKPNVWAVEVRFHMPPMPYKIMAIKRTMTIVKMPDGTLTLLNCARLDKEQQGALDRLGTVRELNANTIFIPETSRLWSEAGFPRRRGPPSHANTVLVCHKQPRLSNANMPSYSWQVQHMVTLGGGHGGDDPYYKNMYPTATMWSPAGALMHIAHTQTHYIYIYI